MHGSDSFLTAFRFTEPLLLIQSVALLLIFFRGLYTLFEKYKNLSLNESKRWIVLVSFVLGFTSLFIYSFHSLEYNHFLLSLALSLGLVLALFSPSLGLMLFLSMILVRPWEVLPDNELISSLPKISFYLAMASLLLHRALRLNFKIVIGKDGFSLLAMSLLILIGALIFSSQESKSDYFDTYIRAVLLFFLIKNILFDEVEYSLIRFTISIGLTSAAFASIYYFTNLNGKDFLDGERLAGFGILGNSNDLAAVMVMVMPLSISSILRKERNIFSHLFGLLLLSFQIFTIYYAQSRGALMAALFLILVFLFLQFKTLKQKITLIAGAVLIVLLSMSLTFNRTSADSEESVDNRLNFWKTGLNMAIHNPILGVGYGNFPDQFERYASEIKGEYGKRTAHSSWILLMAEAGFPALILLGLLYWNVLKVAYFVRFSAPELIYATVGYGVAISFLSHTYMMFPYLLFSLVISYGNFTNLNK